MTMSALDSRLAFLREIDKLKNIIRATQLVDKSRRENSAEHSWHLAMYALVLGEHAADPIDLTRVIKMLLIHDIVEIDAGDTPIHGAVNQSKQAEEEFRAAERLFGMLPSDQGTELRALWMEFEAAVSDDAKFAKSLDRLQPLIHNIETDGGTWQESGVSHEQVKARYGPTIQAGSTDLWECASQLVSDHFQG